MKKILSVLLVLVMSLSFFAGCSSKTPTTGQGASNGNSKLEPYTMGVLFFTIGAQELQMKNYLEKYVGPAFNVKFIFSDAIDSTEKSMTFIENAYSSGAKAILSFDTNSEPVAAKCQELKLYLVTNQSKTFPNADKLSQNVASIGTLPTDSGKTFQKALNSLINDGKKHNVIIVSGGAGIGTSSHYETAVSILKTLQEKYGLTYGETIEKLAASKAATEVKTGTDMKIYIYPGFAGSDTYVPGLSTVLQTGQYDTLLSVYQVYTQFSAAIDEVEKSKKMNIRVASVAPLADQTAKSFETIDSTGDTSINAVVVKQGSIIALMFAAAYNALTGNADLLKVDGKAQLFSFENFTATSAQEYMTLSKLDKDESTYVYTIDEIKQMIKKFNDKLDKETFAKWVKAMELESVKQRRGLK